MRVADDAGHVEELLGLYHLDALDETSAARVREHLDACVACRVEAGRVCEVLGVLALLIDERETLVNAYGALGTAAPPAFPERFAPLEEPEDESGRLRRMPWTHRVRRLGRSGAAGTPAASPPATAAVPEARPATAPAGSPVAPGQRAATRPPRSASTPPRSTPAPEPAGRHAAAPPAVGLPTSPPGLPAPSPDQPVPSPDQPAPSPAGLPAAPALPSAAVAGCPAPGPTAPAMRVSRPGPRLPAVGPTLGAKVAPGAPSEPVVDAAPAAAFPAAATPAPATEQVATPAVVGQPRRAERKRALVFSIGMLAITVTLGGLAVGALVRSGPESTAPGLPIVVSTAASATDVDSRAELAVSLTQVNGSVQVRATLAGLKKGVGYRLYGYSLDGTRWPIVNWTGKAGKVQVTGTTPVPIADVSHFVVLRSDRTTVVTVYLSNSEGANIGPNGN